MPRCVPGKSPGSDTVRKLCSDFWESEPELELRRLSRGGCRWLLLAIAELRVDKSSLGVESPALAGSDDDDDVEDSGGTGAFMLCGSCDGDQRDERITLWGDARCSKRSDVCVMARATGVIDRSLLN